MSATYLVPWYLTYNYTHPVCESFLNFAASQDAILQLYLSYSKSFLGSR